jgi:hypothetical protein
VEVYNLAMKKIQFPISPPHHKSVHNFIVSWASGPCTESMSYLLLEKESSVVP